MEKCYLAYRRKVSLCEVDFVKCKQNFFPRNWKVMFIYVCDKNDLGHRDLAWQETRSRYLGKLFAFQSKTLRLELTVVYNVCSNFSIMQLTAVKTIVAGILFILLFFFILTPERK